MPAQSKDTPLIICLGELLVDMFPAELGRRLADVSAFQPKPGGAPANAAVAIAKLGHHSAFVGKVGDDAFGHHLYEVIKEQGVDVSGMRFDAYARTTLAFIAKPDENSAEYVFYRNPGADLMLKADELDRDLFSQVKALHFGSVSLVDKPLLSTVKEAIKLARQVNALISFDVNHRPSLWDSEAKALERIWEMVPQANLLKVNEYELRLLSGMEEIDETNPLEACQRLLSYGPELIVVTLGDKGSYFCTQQEHAFISPFKVKTVDAVGCGDAFIAGILTRLVRVADWRTRLAKEALLEDFRYANAVGALTATKQGVIPSLPTAEQVEQFLKEHA